MTEQLSEKEIEFLGIYLDFSNWRPARWSRLKEIMDYKSDNSIAKFINQIERKTGIDLRNVSVDEAKQLIKKHRL